MSKVCAQCKNYLGGGDWGLDCSKMQGLTSEDSPADGCESFEQATVCRNASRIIGGFRCSICGKFQQVVDYIPNETIGDWISRAKSFVVEQCPNCGEKLGGDA